jgi:hypothetical protein
LQPAACQSRIGLLKGPAAAAQHPALKAEEVSMAEFKHRQDRPGPNIQYGEVHFPDEQDLGTGAYTVAVERAALRGEQPVAAVLINRPVFQLALEVNPQSGEVVVTFGRADGAEPALQSVYRLPAEDAGIRGPAVFVVSFERWAVQGVMLDDRALEKIGPLAN